MTESYDFDREDWRPGLQLEEVLPVLKAEVERLLPEKFFAVAVVSAETSERVAGFRPEHMSEVLVIVPRLQAFGIPGEVMLDPELFDDPVAWHDAARLHAASLVHEVIVSVEEMAREMSEHHAAHCPGPEWLSRRAEELSVEPVTLRPDEEDR